MHKNARVASPSTDALKTMLSAHTLSLTSLYVRNGDRHNKFVMKCFADWI